MPYSKIVARDIMDTDPPYCLLDASVEEVGHRFVEEQLSGLLVVDEAKHLFGIITESDLIDQQRQLHLPTAVALFDMVIPMGEARFEEELARLQAMTAEDLAQRNVVSVNVATELSEIAAVMGDKNVHHLPVMDGEDVVGLICRHDVIRALVAG